ncbi:MAG TPA: excinuclease ABC subunit UvrA [Bacteroidia bacterium]
MSEELIEIYGAREHNLKNVSLTLPRNQLVVFTGLSGSGKSSLAFDTIYAEGQRRYLESFSSYARQFLGSGERPEVDKINGLSPVISIEQKTTSKNPRSTVGTVTEIYDFLRLLYARAGDAYSYETGELMVRFTDEQILDWILKDYAGKEIHVLAPLVRGRKGHYRELLDKIRKAGFISARIDGQLVDISFGMKLDRYKVHDVEVLIDTVLVDDKQINRLKRSLQQALKQGKGSIMVLDAEKKGAKARHFSRHLMCPTSGISYDEPAPNLFSFNSPYGACPVCNGLGTVLKLEISKIIPDPKKSIKQGAIEPLRESKSQWMNKQLEQIGKSYGFDLNTPIEDISEEGMHAILYGAEEMVKTEDSEGVHTTRMQFEGIAQFIERQVEEDASAPLARWAMSFMEHKTCDSCGGTRLKKEALHFKILDKNIAELATLDIADLSKWVNEIEEKMPPRQAIIAREVLKEIKKRIGFLLDIGLEYLSLDRPAGTLSGGESQRIRLATQIGSQLTGVLYILDEPSIGLHQRDNDKLIVSLKRLVEAGNSVIVVEHDKDMILAADYVVDIGPGAGIHGGQIVSQGTPKQLLEANTVTAQYLNGKKSIPYLKERRKGNGKFLELKGATGHNLKKVDIKIPLNTITVVTGVSGSGKSSLIRETLQPILSQHFYNSIEKPLPYKSISGLEHIDKVISIDQSPIGRTPRSNPATYTKLFDDIRTLFTELPEAKIRGYKPGRFSFNVKGGRCETCMGAGVKTIEMNFLPDVHVTCETCHGKRYNHETLEVRYKGRSISDVLDMTIEAATEFFEPIPQIYRKLKTLLDIGLGYITLGQSATTLSGGEAQRIKLASELNKKDTGNTVYILDEPTTGLHFEDIRILLNVLQELADKGNTIIIIEHNLDIVKAADWILDMGPEGGQNGGQLVFSGTPEQMIKGKKLGYTATFLKKEM